MTPPPALAEVAAREFHQLQRSAPRAIARGIATRAEAETKLKAWLAIACRLGAGIPLLDAGLAWRREAWPDESEARARALYADDICPRATWAPILAEARDKAIDQLPADPDAPTLTRAIGITHLAIHFAHDINRRDPVPAYRPPHLRPPTDERKAA